MIRESLLSDKWPKVPLGDAIEFLDHKRKPITAKDRILGPYPYYGANGQQDSVNDYLFDESLILLAEDGGNFGNPDRTIAYQIDGKSWVNNHAHVLRPKSNIDIRYLCRHLEKYDVSSHINGATRQKLNKSAAKEIIISLPPLPEQKRIAAILDKADTIRHKRQQAIDLADEFLRSVFLELFGDPVTNPKGWNLRPISDIAEITTGNTPSKKIPENYGSHIEWIKSDNINTPKHYLTEASEYLSKQGLEKARVVSKGSILMTCIAGSKECIGNAAITDRDVSFNQQINALTPKSNSTTEYLYSIALFGKKLIQSASTNGMKGMVSKGKLEKLNVPVPPMELKEKYSMHFQRYLKNRSRLNESLNNAHDLFNSLSQKAFSGKL